jgi:Zn-dependent M28 family amino/carboxypeptidase
LSERLGITVLVTSAEELGVKGALAYIKENKSELRQQAGGGGLHILNFDGIGVEGKIYLVGGGNRFSRPPNENLNVLVQKSAEEMDIPVGRFTLPGALFDHIPFAQAGFDALSVIGIGKSSWFVHSGNDSPEKLHVDGFNQAGRLAIRVIEKFSRLAI